MEASNMSFLDDWKEWSTAKKAISIIGVCCIGILIIAAIGGGLSSDKNTSPATTSTSSNNSNNDDTAKEDTTTNAKGVQIHIIYDGDWQGAMGSGSSTKTISGTGETTLDVDDPDFVVSANAQKMDSGSGKLTIQILKDGKVIEETDTDSEYGVASVSATI